MDVPGHASCFRPLEDQDEGGGGVEFCSSKRHQLFNDPGQNTLHTLQELVGEMSRLFGGSVIHVGGDETEEQGSCQRSTTQDLTTSMQYHVKEVLHKIPMVWNEVETVSVVDGVDYLLVPMVF